MTSENPIALAKAINEGLRVALKQDKKVLVCGEDIGPLGGVFRVTDGLIQEFGEKRVFDTPLAESGIIGTAIGLALRGYRPVCEIQFDGFIFPGFDQITTQLAKMHYRSEGKLHLPVVIRVPYGGGIGGIEHHSESPEVLFAHTPGLRVVSPATPQDAYVMIQEAIHCPDPVLFFEPKGRYWQKSTVDLSQGPYAGTSQWESSQNEQAYPTLNQAQIAKRGTDLTLVAYGPSVHNALNAAQVASEEGKNIEVIDLRTISPLDIATVIESVKRTQRCVVVHEAHSFYGPGAEIASQVTQECFYHLQAPVLRVGGYHMPYPVAKNENEYLPNVDRILDAVDESFTH